MTYGAVTRTRATSARSALATTDAGRARGFMRKVCSAFSQWQFTLELKTKLVVIFGRYFEKTLKLNVKLKFDKFTSSTLNLP